MRRLFFFSLNFMKRTVHLAFHKFYICYYFNLLPINYNFRRISVIVSETLQSKSTNCHACFEIVSPATENIIWLRQTPRLIG